MTVRLAPAGLMETKRAPEGGHRGPTRDDVVALPAMRALEVVP